MEKRNSLTFNIPSTLDKEIEMFCELNEIEDKNELILGCIKAQSQYPQLTTAQWRIVMEIKKKYKDE